MSIGENLKKIRMDKRLSQSELAERVGISQSMVAQLEQDRKILTLPLGGELAKELGCKVDDFIKR